MKILKVEIETLVQFAICILQTVGIFIAKPDMFNFYEQGSAFAAGDPSVFIVIIVSIILLYFSIKFNGPKHARSWLTSVCVAAVLFAGAFIWYNIEVKQKTFLCTDDALGAQRIIKGNHFLPTVSHCDLLKKKEEKADICSIVRQCIDYTQPSDLANIWPHEEIVDNKEKLLTEYYLCLMLASFILISGVQIIKCKQNNE